MVVGDFEPKFECVMFNLGWISKKQLELLRRRRRGLVNQDTPRFSVLVIGNERAGGKGSWLLGQVMIT